MVAAQYAQFYDNILYSTQYISCDKSDHIPSIMIFDDIATKWGKESKGGWGEEYVKV